MGKILIVVDSPLFDCASSTTRSDSSALLIELDRVHHETCHQAQEHEVQPHLDRDRQPSSLGLRGDVAEPDGREDGGGEVQGIGATDRSAERCVIGPSHEEVRRGEQQYVERDAKRERLDGTTRWMV